MVEPSQLAAADFRGYPPLARSIAEKNLGLLREMPTAFIALLLRELINWDWKFPAERKGLDRQFAYLNSIAAEQRANLFAPFARLKLNSELQAMDWVNEPAAFSEKLSSHLWATHQIDSFRSAAIDFFDKVSTAAPEATPAIHRVVLVALGQGTSEHEKPLFRKLRTHGTYFSRVEPGDGFRAFLRAAQSRAASQPEPFSHWCIDGDPIQQGDGLTCVSYAALKTVRASLQQKMRQVFESGTGPEAFRSLLARMVPSDLGMAEDKDPVLSRFQLSLLTEGSGTQVFSTTFVQWAARESLRRAQPLTLVARFTPRQRERPMNELLNEAQGRPELDPRGSLIDGDMGAYYTWLNQQRLTGAAQSTFLAWFEPGTEAIAVGPKFARNASSPNPIQLSAILDQVV